MRMKFSRYLKAFLCTAGAVLWLMTGILFSASADTVKGSLTLICRTDDVILTGLHWDLYRVGSRIGPDFVLDGDFSDYQVDLTDFSAEGMSNAAKTLENYADVDGISPLSSGETGADGLMKFENLVPGLYLLTGTNLKIGTTTYVPSTLLLEIDNSGQSVDLNAYPKIIYRIDSSEVVFYTVKKIWRTEDEQPVETTTPITVEIYCNNELYETITLSDENDWTYEWEGESDDEWRVKEVNIPDNCTVVYDSNETQFAIVNTVSPPIVTTTTTITTTNKTETTTTTKAIVTTTKKPNDEKIPQTGQLWWPVPLLGLMGIICIAVGFRICSLENNERNNEKK